MSVRLSPWKQSFSRSLLFIILQLGLLSLQKHCFRRSRWGAVTMEAELQSQPYLHNFQTMKTIESDLVVFTKIIYLSLSFPTHLELIQSNFFRETYGQITRACYQKMKHMNFFEYIFVEQLLVILYQANVMDILILLKWLLFS